MPISLSNIRIVDLSRVLAGPLCTMALGDLGADVIKVERPGLGDETRHWGPPFDARGRSAYFLSINRNKLSVALNLAEPADRVVFMELVRDADVVLDNFRKGALGAWSIEPAEMLERHAKLIWCTISGFGPTNDRPGYDYVVQAESGWMSITGESAGDPMKTGVALADVIAGKDAAIAILGALLQRENSDQPLAASQRRLHISLKLSATAALVNVAQNLLVSGEDSRRWGNAHPNLVPYQLFHAADRLIVIAVGNDAQWVELCKALDLTLLASDTALATNAGRLKARDRVVKALEERLLQHSAEHWLGRLAAAAVPAGVVRSVREALQDVTVSPVTGIEPAVQGTVRFPPPGLDEHGEIIRKLGWDAFGALKRVAL